MNPYETTEATLKARIMELEAEVARLKGSPGAGTPGAGTSGGDDVAKTIEAGAELYRTRRVHRP